MSSLEALKTRALAARGVVQQTLDQKAVALRLRYSGTGSVTSVTTAAGSLVTISTEGTKTYAFATYTTIGALQDKINADGVFEAKILDALRSDATTASSLVNASGVVGAITSGSDGNGVTIWDLLVDSTVALNFSAALVWSRDFFTNKLAQGHRVKLQEIDYYLTMGTAAANSVRIYQRRGTIETQIFGALSVKSTLTAITIASGYGTITGLGGDAFVVRVQDAATFATATTNFLRVAGIAE